MATETDKPTAHSVLHDAAQKCRYYLKRQNHPALWENKSEYEKGVEVACKNIEAILLAEAIKYKPANAS